MSAAVEKRFAFRTLRFHAVIWTLSPSAETPAPAIIWGLQPCLTTAGRTPLMRLRDLRPARFSRRARRRRRIRRTAAQLAEKTAATLIEWRRRRTPSRRLLAGRRAGRDNRSRLTLETRNIGQCQAGEKKARCQQRGGAGQHIGGAAAGQKAARGADKAAALGFLQQHHADQGKHQHKVNDDKDVHW